MFGNRLKRKDLSNKYDYYHVKNKINDKKQALIYLDELLNYLNQFDYYDDDNFILVVEKNIYMMKLLEL